MKKQILMIMMLQFSIIVCLGQNFGARLTAMGMNSAAVTDEWNLTGNPAGITAIRSPTLSLNYMKYLTVADLSRQAIALTLPIGYAALGFYLDRYGITQYNEINTGAAFAKKFGDKFSLALRINYHQIKISNYGATTGFSVDVGAIYRMNEQLTIGLYINNPTLQKYTSRFIQTTIPTAIYTGISYHISDKVLLATTISKYIGLSFDTGFGIDYKLIQLLSLRAGLTIKPFKQYAGFGLSYNKLIIDVTIESDPFISYKPQFGISYAF
jgi:hypothetical protein